MMGHEHRFIHNRMTDEDAGYLGDQAMNDQKDREMEAVVVPVKIMVPSVRNFVRTFDGKTAIHIADLDDAKLREIGTAWTEALITHAQECRAKAEGRSKGTMNDEREAFTVVFSGDARKFIKDMFLTETPFGLPYAIAIGDALEDLDKLKGTPSSFDEEAE